MSEETMYHINPTTGNVNKCNAKYQCKFKIRTNQHYSSREEAMEASEESLAAEMMDADNVTGIIANNVQVYDNDNLLYDPIISHADYIKEWTATSWTKEEKENLHYTYKIFNLVAGEEKLSEKDEEKIKKFISRLHPIKNPNRYSQNSFGTGIINEYQRRDRNIISLAKALYWRKKVDSMKEPDPAPQREANHHLIGLEDAQRENFNKYNDPGYEHLNGRKMMGDSAEKYLDDTINRYINGEEHVYHGNDYEPAYDRLMKEISDSNQLYLALVFPDKELKESMEKAGVSQVTVTPFYNSREWGNAYTVLEPDGSTRTFSVYEHRNTDSIIINGKKNWKGKEQELPYAADSKNAFFEEFPPDDRQRAADTLVYYMKAAQKGDLDDDGKLATNGSRRDWIAILSDTLPGFSEWHKENVPEYYHAQEELTEEEKILKKLDFDVDEN